ncbi:PAS domain-containing protein [Alloyangia pacifica]|uniref:PAS domain-containing protein n=1 Tax=Alloyangia pacifica TaxID=311180 RepID=UPI001CFD56CC|nr:PAS domain-containing protein [Alloyangia pacifica]
MFELGGDGKGVVSMTEREKEQRLAALKQIESYWRELLGEDGQVPLRSQIDPRGIESALEYAFLGERIAPMLAKLRVAGTHLNDIMGLDMAGMPLSTLIAPEDREQLGAAVSKLFSDGLVIRLHLVAEEGFGKGRLTGDMLLLPLRSDLGDMSRMIGALVTHGRLGRTPRRFRIESISMRPPVAGEHPQFTDPSDAPKATLKPPLQGLSEDAAVYRPAPAQSRDGKRPPYLRLVISNDD